MVERGDPSKYTAMSKLVGFPTAIASRLLLEGKITKKGVYGPFEKSIFDFGLNLEKIEPKSLISYKVSL